MIPVQKIRIQGGLPLDAKHPFLATIQHGSHRLERFYRDFQPNNLAEMYRLQKLGLAGEELPPWELPWMGRDIRHAPKGEAGLSDDHGVSFYGPCTQRKVEVETIRLNSTVQSIVKNGYRPDLHGDIEGYGLIGKEDFRFFVRGGKHRLAALASLGWENIPVSFRPFWPNAIFQENLDDWPLVSNGSMSPQVALRIFERYFDD